jgi:sugar O-acyltransferase (sialic acid O-acetyltransferase NeuD family)
MENIVLIGGGNQAHYTIDIVEKEGKYNIIGIVDSIHEKNSVRFGYRILGKQEDIQQIVIENKINAGIITIGDNWGRYFVYKQMVELMPDFVFVNAIHPSVVIGNNVTLGYGIVAMAGCIINPKSRIGNFTFFATRALIEHDNEVCDFSSVSAGSITGGYVKIGKFSAVTMGVTIIDRIVIGENVVVGSGSLVTKNIKDDVLIYGSPAKLIRVRSKGEKFLK